MSRRIVLHSGSLAELRAAVGCGDLDVYERLSAEMEHASTSQGRLAEIARQIVLDGRIYAPDQALEDVNAVLAALAAVLAHFSPLTSGARLSAYWYIMERLQGEASLQALREALDIVVNGRRIDSGAGAASNGATCGYLRTVELPSFILALRRIAAGEAGPDHAEIAEDAEFCDLIDDTCAAAAKAVRDELDLFAFSS